MCYSQQTKTCGRTFPCLLLQRGRHVPESSRVDFLNDVVEKALEVTSASAFEGDSGLSKLSSLEPTPIASLQVKFVPEIKLGSAWNSDESSAELVRQLFTPHHEVDIQSWDETDEYEPIPITYTSSGQESTDVAELNQGWSAKVPETWQERFQELVQFRKQYGHCVVSHNWKRNKGLGQWVKRQRYQFKLKCRGRQTTLSNDRVKALNEIGFVWNSQSLRWEEKFQELAEFSNLHGHCNVPSRYPENHQLSVWVRSQRRQFKLHMDGDKTSNMTTERINKLKSLGFLFVPRNTFKLKF